MPSVGGNASERRCPNRRHPSGCARRGRSEASRLPRPAVDDLATPGCASLPVHWIWHSRRNHYILTAAHVWHEATTEEQLGLALTTYPSAFAMPRDAIVANDIWDRNNAEWGPDLALLQIPQPFVPRIQAHKSFLNLAQHRAAFGENPPELDRLWAVTGMVQTRGSANESRECPRVRAANRHLALDNPDPGP